MPEQFLSNRSSMGDADKKINAEVHLPGLIRNDAHCNILDLINEVSNLPSYEVGLVQVGHSPTSHIS